MMRDTRHHEQFAFLDGHQAHVFLCSCGARLEPVPLRVPSQRQSSRGTETGWPAALECRGCRFSVFRPAPEHPSNRPETSGLCAPVSQHLTLVDARAGRISGWLRVGADAQKCRAQRQTRVAGRRARSSRDLRWSGVVCPLRHQDSSDRVTTRLVDFGPVRVDDLRDCDWPFACSWSRFPGLGRRPCHADAHFR